MPRTFVLCDPNIVKDGGHYLEYARMVLGAAEACGYRPLIAVNESCQVQAPDGWGVLPVFRYGFWGRRLGMPANLKQRLTPADRRYLRLKYSDKGVLWEAAGSLRETQHFNRMYPISDGTMEQMRAISDIRALTELYLRADLAQHGGDGPPEDWTTEDRERSYNNLRRAIRSALATVRDRDTSERALAAAAARSAMSSNPAAQDASALQDLTEMAHRAASFADAMRRVLDATAPAAGDVILYPTISYFELRGLKDVLDTHPRAHVLSHHVVLRRNVYSGYSSSFDGQEWNVHSIRTALALLNDLDERVRVRFYTDTEPLTYQYDLLGTAKFVTGPVPVDMVERARPLPIPVRRSLDHPILLLIEANSVDEVRLLALQLQTVPTGLLGPISVKIVVRGAGTIGEYLVSDLSGRHAFGDLEFILPEDLDGIAAASFGIIAFGCWRENYSRLALQAYELGRPVLVPPLSWLARAICQESFEFHNKYLADDAVLVRQDLKALSWTFYEFLSGNRRLAAKQDWIAVEAGAATTADLEVPRGADTVRLLLDRLMSEQLDNILHLIAFFRLASSPDGDVGRHDIPFAGGTQGPLSVVLRVPPGSARLVLSLCNFSRPTPIKVELREVLWFSCGRAVPALPGGLIYPNLVGDFANSWVNPLVILCAAYSSYAESAATWLEPIGLCRRILPPERPMVLTYLGDAREEKGFQLLPALNRFLQTDPGARDIMLKVQIYYTADYPEPACLAAAALLRASSHDGLNLIERPLGSREYACELLKSDALLIAYRPHDYIARSSGIFSEALAGGIPVVIPSGTWMAAQSDSFAYAQHSSLIARDRRVEVDNLNLHSLTQNQVSPLVGSPGVIPILPGVISCAHVPVPDEVDYVWITYRLDGTAPHAFTRFDISFQDSFQDGNEFKKIKRVIGGDTTSLFSLLARVPRKTNAIWLGMYSASGYEHYELKNFSMKFVLSSGPRVPEFAGGVIYFTGDDGEELERELAAAVLRLRSDYDLYVASASMLQPIWAKRHSPTRLIELMEMPFTEGEQACRTRFKGADW